MFLPNIIAFVFKLQIAPFMQLIYELYLILHFIFGEICNFYVVFNYYDTILHFTTAILLSILGYSIIHYYLDDKVIFIQVLFAFLFALSSEFFWEILEFSIDHFFDTNMQRFIKNGIMLIGHESLKDTIKDMVVATMGGGCIIFLVKIKIIKNAKISIKNAYKYTVELSYNGSTVFSSKSANTLVTAIVKDLNVDITHKLPIGTEFIWYRNGSIYKTIKITNDNKPQKDVTNKDITKLTANQINVTHEDIVGNSFFSCEVNFAETEIQKGE
jgi:hypothetical protein